MTALEASGVLAIWNDVAPGGDAEFNEWYFREHIPERVGVPGFRRGRRYAAVSGEPRYFCFYETDGLEVLTSPPYLERLNNPTSWTRRIMPLFRNMNRTPCRVTRSVAHGEGAAAATLRLAPRPGQEGPLREWLSGMVIPDLAEQPGIVAAHLWEADPSATRPPTRERDLRGGEDEVASWVVVSEGIGAGEVQAACRALLAPDLLTARGAEDAPTLGVYRLLSGRTSS